jgi:hypothetical protein
MPKQILFFIDENHFRIRDKNYQVELFKQDYLSNTNTREEFAIKYNITVGVLKKILVRYKIKRSVEKVSFINENMFLINGVSYQVKELIDQYINDNVPMSFFLEKWKISSPTFEKIISYYKIFKDPYQRSKNGAQTNLQKYGVKWFTQTQIMKDKSKITLFKNYGVTNAYESDIIQNKIKQTNLQRYNTEYAIASAEVRAKIKSTNLNRYGVESTLQVNEFQNKIKQTNLSRYGTENPLASKQIQDKIHKTNELKYHCKNPVQRNILHYDIWSDDTQFIQLLEVPEGKTFMELGKFFNVDETSIRNKACILNVEDKIKKVRGYSRYEEEIYNFLIEDLKIAPSTIIKHDRRTLKGQEIDLYLQEYHLGIEFNGDYWHSDIYKTDHNGRSIYHQEKSLIAEEKGIFLFHIFEYEWNNPVTQENIKSRLKTLLFQNSYHIPARRCFVQELTKVQKKVFLDNNHIQGNDRCSKQYGLIFQNELVACMTFVKPKNKKYTWELSRFCSKKDYTIQGGASKLFKYFINTLKEGDTISSYNDITKTKGDLYKILGFICVSINDPNYIWMNFNTNDVRTRYQEQKAGEVERMHLLGYHRICDCGTRTWVYTIE